MASLTAMPDCGEAQANVWEPAERHVFAPDPSLAQEVGQHLGLANLDDTYFIAIVTGVDSYPYLGWWGQTLEAARTDRARILDVLEMSGANEALILWNTDFTEANLAAIVENYVVPALAEHPRSRLLVAHSGHGTSNNDEGFLLTEGSGDFSDTSHMVALSAYLDALRPAVREAHQSLVLLNACESGVLIKPFGGEFIPRERGAHVVTAGGSDEPTWGTRRDGSVFFQHVFAGVAGAADLMPETGGDRVVTTHELTTYLQLAISDQTNQNQMPNYGELDFDGDGMFFFVVPEENVSSGIDGQPMNGPEPPVFGGEGWLSYGRSDIPIFRGQAHSEDAGSSFHLQTSLTSEFIQYTAQGGTLTAEVMFDPWPESVAYRLVRFQSDEVRVEIDDMIPDGFLSSTEVPVHVELNFRVIVYLDQTSDPLRFLPSDVSGEYRIEDFYTSQCDFNCYNINVGGDWTVQVGSEIRKGFFSLSNNGRGVGNDVHTRVRIQRDPPMFTVTDLYLNGNHNLLTNGLSPLVDENFNGVPITVSMPLISFYSGSKDVDLPLTMVRLTTY